MRQQMDAGLDVVSDGEMGKPSFITYAAQRLGGLEKREGSRPSPFSNTRETRDFPDYYQSAVAEQVSARRRRALMVCAGPVKYKGQAQLKIDLDNLKVALKGANAAEAFVPLSHHRISRRQHPTNTIRHKRPMCSPSLRQCAKNTKRSSMPDFYFRSTILSLLLTTSCGQT